MSSFSLPDVTDSWPLLAGLGIATCAAFFGVRRGLRGDSTWDDDNVGDLREKSHFLVTGATSGLGYATASVLLQHNARVIVTARSQGKGEATVARLQAETSCNKSNIEFEVLDLSDLDNVKAFVERMISRGIRLDGMVLNAGVMVPPKSTTAQGIELQFGVNVVGHYAMTIPLLPMLNDSAGISVVASSAAYMASMPLDVDDLVSRSKINYDRKVWEVYSDSKLCNILFALALDKRLKKHDDAGQVQRNLRVSVSHPGWTATDLQKHTPIRFMNSLVAMKSPQGCLSQVRALLEGRDCRWYGPSGWFELGGNPSVLKLLPKGARDNQAAEDKLWTLLAELTNVDVD